MEAMREKLIDLLDKGQRCPTTLTNCSDCQYHDRDEWDYCNKAAATADMLIANGVTIQKWIPVTERLPEKNGKYLCRYVFNDYYDMPFVQVLSYYATDKKPHYQNEGDGLGMKVTHWMPLPPAAEGG